ncbi:TPA: hypothetical protein ACM2VO_002500 [Legionella pneumophila]
MATLQSWKTSSIGYDVFFFNPEDGKKLLEKTQTPNFVQALSVLNHDARQIISELWLHHTGW